MRRRALMGGAKAPNLRDGLLAEWLLESDLLDTSGNGFNLLASATPTFNTDSEGSHVVLNNRYLYRNAKFLNPLKTSSYTISLHFNTVTVPRSYAMIISWAQNTAYTGHAFSIGHTTSYPVVYVRGNGLTNMGLTLENTTANVWYYYAVTYDVDTDITRVYLDSVLRDENTEAIKTNQNAQYFNINAQLNGQNMGNHLLRHIRIHNRVLTASEIAELGAL